MTSVTELLRTKEIERFTEPAIDYADLSGFETLKLKELGYADDEEMRGQISTLKFLSADDKGCTVEYSVRK